MNERYKNLEYKDVTLEKMKKGIIKVDKLVSPTMGSMGKHTVIEMPGGSPLIINDGINIARQIELEDKIENLGARLVINAMTKTASLVGDSTSLTCNIMTNLAKKSIESIEKFKLNHIPFIQGISKALIDTVEYIKSQSRPVESDEDLYNVAFIASRDEILSRLMVDTVTKMGEHGIIQKMRSYTGDHYSELIKGMVLDFGLFEQRLLLEKDVATLTSIMQNVKVLVLKNKLDHSQYAANILETFKEYADSEYKEHGKKVSLLIIAPSYSAEVIELMINSKNENYLEFIEDFHPVLAPGSGDADRYDLLNDIAALSLSKITDSLTLSKCNAEQLKVYLGSVSEVVIQPKSTILKGENNEKVKGSVDSRIATLIKERDDKDVTKGDISLFRIQSRISRLSGVVAVLRIFGHTDIEFQDYMEKTDDALRTIRTSQVGGIIPGGGNTLRVAYNKLSKVFVAEKLKETGPINESFERGYQTFVQTLNIPFETICKNAGLLFPYVMLSEDFKGEAKLNPELGINVSNWTTGNLYELGVLDATNSIITALKNSVANIKLLIRIEGSITTVPK